MRHCPECTRFCPSQAAIQETRQKNEQKKTRQKHQMALIWMYRVVLDPNWIPSNSFRVFRALATDGAALLATEEIIDDFYLEKLFILFF